MLAGLGSVLLVVLGAVGVVERNSDSASSAAPPPTAAGKWSTSELNAARQGFCKKMAKVSVGSSDCDCIMGLVLDVFDTPQMLCDSTELPDAFTEGMQACGFTPTS